MNKDERINRSRRNIMENKIRNDTDYGKQGWFFEEDYGDLYNAVLLTIRAIQNLESTIVGGKQ